MPWPLVPFILRAGGTKLSPATSPTSPLYPRPLRTALLAAGRKLDEAPLTRQQMEAKEKNAKTCAKYHGKSNGQGSVIDAYNQATPIADILERHGYQRSAGRWKRPGGKSLSVFVSEGRSFHHSSNDPLSNGYWRRPFDVFCTLDHGGDCRAAVKAAADLLGMKTQPGLKAEPQRIEYRRITCAELDATTYQLEYLIDNTLVAGQPCGLAGGKKDMKTSLLIDLGISLAMAGCFLGKLRVNRTCRVGIMTGESGLGTIQETARRICRAAGYNLADIGGLIFSDQLPRFGSFDHQDAVRRFIADDELEVLAIDPTYLCMPGADANNYFIQGELLRSMGDVCADAGCMMVLAVHNKKGRANPFAPPELEDIAWAGFQEYFRQWLLLGRRERYEPGTGEHRLWLNVGGSAGHSALWAVDISEGTRETEGGRFWSVNVMHADEARNEVQDRKEAEKAAKVQTALERDAGKVLTVLAKATEGATKSAIRTHAGLSGARVNAVVAWLLGKDRIVETTIQVSNHKTPQTGYRLAETKDDT